ncbi:hypothetical protein [Bailinhaonella thermotolerans]|uniref:Uncharacterized protein n=1 Tax=Bailinhaonella thermotolerans TaxID=1070861 RepID=A0A3A4A9P9_9ACTN|nr:hypothetical protein [Bailinhaonella thermotolerans]RJL24759.1 hypothetical protein D5H75_28645 [Bailinhaonella thermotolerans]
MREHPDDAGVHVSGGNFFGATAIGPGAHAVHNVGGGRGAAEVARLIELIEAYADRLPDPEAARREAGELLAETRRPDADKGRVRAALDSLAERVAPVNTLLELVTALKSLLLGE